MNEPLTSKHPPSDQLVRPLHPLFQRILGVHGMKPMKHSHGRICAICGKRGGRTEGFNTILRLNGFKGEKAHPACVSDLRVSKDAERAK